MLRSCSNCQRIYRGESDYIMDTSAWVKIEDKLFFTCSCGYRLNIKNKSNWFSHKKLMSKENQLLYESRKELLQLPKVAINTLKVKQMLHSANTPAEELVQAIRSEPFLMAEVLKLSKFIGGEYKQDIKDLQHAIDYLGRKNITSLVDIASFKNLKQNDSDFPLANFWFCSFARGYLALKMLNIFELSLNSDETYLAAVLANIGKLTSAIAFPDATSKIMQLIRSKNLTWDQAEKHYGIDHRALGEIAAIVWGMPKLVLYANKYYHSVLEPNSPLGEPLITQMNLIYLANKARIQIEEGCLSADELEICQRVTDSLSRNEINFERLTLDLKKDLENNREAFSLLSSFSS